MVTRSSISINNHNAFTIGQPIEKRGLGDVHLSHNTMTHPAMSCRSFDAESVRSQLTYRPLSSEDIIHQQHKLLHNVRPANRIHSAFSCSDRYSQHALSVSQLGHRRLISQSNTSVPDRFYVRPNTCVSVAPTRPLSTPRSITYRTRRPKTTGHVDKISTSLQSYILLKDSALDCSIDRKKGEINQRIRDQWTPRNHDLSAGEFVKGQGKNIGNVYSASFNTWVTFSGTNTDDGGLVDAFTLFEDEENFYNIDSSVGSRVAQQLLHGDKIRIGVNGRMHAHNLKIRRAVNRDDETVADTESTEEVSIPLSLDDLVAQPGVTVKEVKPAPTHVPLTKSADTRFVVYEKFFTTPEPRPLLASVRSPNPGKMSNAQHKHASKQARNTSRILDISSGACDGSRGMTIDEILQHHVSISPSSRRGGEETVVASDSDHSMNGNNDGNTNSNDSNGNDNRNNNNGDSSSRSRRDSVKKSQTTIEFEQMKTCHHTHPQSSPHRHAGELDLCIDLTNNHASRELRRVGNCRNGLIRSTPYKGGKSLSSSFDNNSEFIKFSSQLAAGKETFVVKATNAVSHQASPPLSGRPPTPPDIASSTEMPDIMEEILFRSMSPIRTNSPASGSDVPLSPLISIPTASAEGINYVTYNTHAVANTAGDCLPTGEIVQEDWSTSTDSISDSGSNNLMRIFSAPPGLKIKSKSYTAESKSVKSAHSSASSSRPLTKKVTVHFDLKPIEINYMEENSNNGSDSEVEHESVIEKDNI